MGRRVVSNAMVTRWSVTTLVPAGILVTTYQQLCRAPAGHQQGTHPFRCPRDHSELGARALEDASAFFNKKGHF